MPNTKQPPCCARLQARLIMDQANLRRLAVRASKRVEKGLDTTVLEAHIVTSKAAVESAREAIVDHEADHAGGGL